MPGSGDTSSMRDKGDVGDKVEAIQNVLEEWVVCLSTFVSYLENFFVLFMPTFETFKKTIHKMHIQRPLRNMYLVHERSINLCLKYNKVKV